MAAPISLVLAAHEPALRQRLRSLLEGLSVVRLAADCATGTDAVDLIREYQPAVVLIDAQLPDLSALEIVERVGADQMPAVMFVTKVDSTLLRVFEVHGLPYLVRPFGEKRFRAELRRTVFQTEPRALAGVRRRLERMLAADEEGSRERRIPVRNAGKTQYVDLDDIRWVEGAGAFSRLHLDDGTHVVKATLDALADRFADGFLRIHSTLVRSSEVAEIERTEEGEALVTLRDGRSLRLSADAQPEVIQAP